MACLPMRSGVDAEEYSLAVGRRPDTLLVFSGYIQGIWGVNGMDLLSPRHSIQGSCSGLQYLDARLAIEPPSRPTIIDSGSCSRPTFIAPEPTVLILGSQ